MVSPDVVGIGSEYFAVYFRVYIYDRRVCHYIAATVVYLVQRIVTACVVVICFYITLYANSRASFHFG